MIAAAAVLRVRFPYSEVVSSVRLVIWPVFFELCFFCDIFRAYMFSILQSAQLEVQANKIPLEEDADDVRATLESLIKKLA